MTININVDGTLDTKLTVIANTSATTLLDAADGDLYVQRVLYTSPSGDTITFDTYDGSNARRLHQWVIAANDDGAYPEEFTLKQGLKLRATLATGNSTIVRVVYVIPV